MDNNMPDQTTGETAARIKEVILYYDKFILLATSKQSNLIGVTGNLELGRT